MKLPWNEKDKAKPSDLSHIKNDELGSTPSDYDLELYAQLSTWRNNYSGTHNLTLDEILTDAQLKIISSAKPSDSEALSKLGLDPARVDLFEEVINTFVLESNMGEYLMGNRTPLEDDAYDVFDSEDHHGNINLDSIADDSINNKP